MLDQSLKDQIINLFGGLKSSYIFRIEVSPSHPNREELVNLLEEVASCSEKVSCTTQNGPGLKFTVLKDNEPLAFEFRAVPNGHEFTSLLLAVLNADGIGKNLPDETIKMRIKALQGPVEVRSYISLTCTNCPDVVQALNIISILNPSISHIIVDGSINQDEVEKLNIQAVPAVYVNGKLLHVGRSSLGELLAKLEELVGSKFEAIQHTYKEYDVIVFI